MSHPDWSKAPEGATHINGAGIFQRENQDGSVSEYFGGRWNMTSKSIHDFAPEYIQSRPAEWNGQGLPPVGAKCMTERNDFLREVTILCHGDVRIFVFDHSIEEECALRVVGRRFFPIKTPEQIAAEERENELNSMVATAKMLDKGWARKVCEALYDNGYRKVEPK